MIILDMREHGDNLTLTDLQEEFDKFDSGNIHARPDKIIVTKKQYDEIFPKPLSAFRAEPRYRSVPIKIKGEHNEITTQHQPNQGDKPTDKEES